MGVFAHHQGGPRDVRDQSRAVFLLESGAQATLFLATGQWVVPDVTVGLIRLQGEVQGMTLPLAPDALRAAALRSSVTLLTVFILH